MPSEHWERLEGSEVGSTVRVWQNGDQRVHVEDVRDSELHKDSYIVAGSDYKTSGHEAICEAIEAVIEHYGVIPKNSAWQHQASGNRFIVKDTDPDPDDDSEPYVLCAAPDYDTRDEVYLGRRLFDNGKQLRLLEWNL